GSRTPVIHRLSLHDALPISGFVSSTATIASLGMQVRSGRASAKLNAGAGLISCIATLLQLLLIVLGVSVEWFKFLLIPSLVGIRSEEHTSELQSRENLVCRL